MASLDIHELADAVARAPRGTRGALMRDHARRLGLSVGQLYRRLQEVRGKRLTGPRNRRISDEAIRTIERVRARCTDAHDGRTLPADLAIEIARKNGLLDEPVSVGQFHRRSKAAALRSKRRVVHFQARRSNEMHQMDASGSVYLRAVTRDGEARIVIDVDRHDPKNRPNHGRRHLWAYGVVDDHSRVWVGRYVIAPGESMADSRDVLAWAWSDHDPSRTLAGVPDKLCCDNGPFVSSNEGKQFLRSLGVELIPRAPHNPRAGGKIERPWRTLWSRFELQFLLDPGRVLTLAELNSELMVYLTRENARCHPWEHAARTAVYLRDRGEIRRLPDGYLRASFRDDPRKVGDDAVVRYRNEYYRAPDELMGRWVHVYRSADGRIACAGDDGQVYALESYAPHAAGEYHTPKPRPGDEVAREAAELPALRSVYADADPPATIAIPAHGRAVALDTPFDRAGKFPSVATALIYLAQRVGRPLAWFEPDHLKRIEALIESHEMACEYVIELADELRDLA